ncbi:hypothetical protein IEO21_10231 [Rhodonia placenta]|uniref:RNA polymerase II-associated protein 3 n=1 Tax=Rhodonia placenta TaxID=104341 RepID=A0A8H7NT84_9APHY|nr:hypothetical protein IEO21_10231 [Postia placenta]
MSATRAQSEKDKGNAAFKAGDYPTAIGHYSAAVVADPQSPTYPLNRAAAYLKLGKNEDAERDCTTVLRLDAKNVKAMFRRGQARVALERLKEARDGPANGYPLKTDGPEKAKAPITLFAFTKQWEKTRSSEERWHLLNAVPPAALPALFQASLDAALLAGMLSTLRDALRAAPGEEMQARVLAYMQALPRVPRFGAVVLFMSDAERGVARDVWELLGGGDERTWG